MLGLCDDCWCADMNETAYITSVNKDRPEPWTRQYCTLCIIIIVVVVVVVAVVLVVVTAVIFLLGLCLISCS